LPSGCRPGRRARGAPRTRSRSRTRTCGNGWINVPAPTRSPGSGSRATRAILVTNAPMRWQIWPLTPCWLNPSAPRQCNNKPMRQIILDTETTGLEAAQNHQIIEIGCLELMARRPTGRHFHQYLNPERDIDEGAVAVHGITRARLEPEPKFAQIAAQLVEFLRGAELIIHNAAFDVAFLDAQFARLPGG